MIGQAAPTTLMTPTSLAMPAAPGGRVYRTGPSLFWRLLVANLVVVLGGAVVGTTVTRHFVLSGRFTPLTHAAMVLVAIALSAAITALILHVAFHPLRALRRAIEDAEAAGSPRSASASRSTGRPSHAAVGRFGDPDIVAVSDAVHRLWGRLDQDVRQLEDQRHELAEKTVQLQRVAALVVSAQEEERRRLARELHDGTMQSVAALIMGLERGLQVMPAGVPHLQEAHQTVERLRDVAAGTLEEIRHLALNLRPAVLDDHGLPAALQWLCRVHEERTGVPAELHGRGLPDRLPPEVETALFRIAQEALANVAKHANASRVTVRLSRRGNRTSLEVTDDGVGIHPGLQAPPEHMGLFNMRERASLLGGVCTIAPGTGANGATGTTVLAEIPA